MIRREKGPCLDRQPRRPPFSFSGQNLAARWNIALPGKSPGTRSLNPGDAHHEVDDHEHHGDDSHIHWTLIVRSILRGNYLEKHKRRLGELESSELCFQEISVGSFKVLKEVGVN